MLRIHCMQQWYSLGDETMEDAMYEIASMRQFAQLSVDKAIPYRTTIMNFRHLPKQHKLTGKWFKTFNQWLSDCGEMMTQDTLVDITVIEAPCPTKTKGYVRINCCWIEKSLFSLRFSGVSINLNQPR